MLKTLLVTLLIVLVACSSIGEISLIEEGEQDYEISSSITKTVNARDLDVPALRAKATFLANGVHVKATMKFNWSATTELSGTVSLGVVVFSSLSAASGDVVVPLEQINIRAGKTLETAAGFRGNIGILDKPKIVTGGKYCALIAWHLTDGLYQFFQDAPIIYCVGLPAIDYTASVTGPRDLLVGNVGEFQIIPLIAKTTKGTTAPHFVIGVGSELEIVSTSGYGWTCEPPSARAVTCHSNNPFSSSIYPIAVNIRAVQPGGASIQATISSLAPDPKPSNNTAALTIVGTALANPADLSVALNSSSTVLNVGTNSFATLSITNNGPSVSALRTLNLYSNTSEIQVVNVSDLSCNAFGVCTVPALLVGETKTVSLELQAQKAFLSSNLNIGLNYVQQDQNQSNNSAYLNFSATNPNLIYDARVEVSNPSSVPLRNVAWNQTITITNDGTNPSPEHRVLNITEDGANINAISPAYCSSSGTYATCDLPIIAPLGSVNIVLTISSSTSGNKSLSTGLYTDLNDNKVSNDYGLKNAYIEPLPNDGLNLGFVGNFTILRTPASNELGQTYQFIVTNTGEITSTGTYAEFYGAQGAFYIMSGNVTNCIRNQSLGSIYCEIPNLAQGATETLTITRTTALPGATHEQGYINIAASIDDGDLLNNTLSFDVVFP